LKTKGNLGYKVPGFFDQTDRPPQADKFTLRSYRLVRVRDSIL
jgi:hypothetical protein